MIQYDSDTLETLPFVPEKASYNYSKTSDVISVQLDGGLSRSRRDIIDNAAYIDCEWFFDSLEFDYFMLFHKVVAGRGAISFQIHLLLDKPELETFTAKFVPNSIQVSEPSSQSYRVTAQLEVEPKPNTGTELQDLLDLRQQMGLKYLFLKSYSFDGIDDYVVHPAIVLSGNYSLSAWVYHEGDNYFALFGGGLYAGGADHRGLIAWEGTVNRWNMQPDGGTSGAFLNGAGLAIPASTWTYVTAVRDALDLKLYFDSVLKATINVAMVDPFTLRRIGMSSSASYQFAGKMREYRIYNDVLTTDEMTYLRTDGASGTNPTTANLQAHFKMDEGTGTTAVDSSGNANHGTITNADLETFHHED